MKKASACSPCGTLLITRGPLSYVDESSHDIWCQKRDRLTRIDARGTKTLSHSRVRVEFLLASSGLVLLHFTCIECVVLTIVNSVSDCVICLCCK